MKKKQRPRRSIETLLAAAAVLSLAAWAFEESAALVPPLGEYAAYAHGLSLVLDSFFLGAGLAVLASRAKTSGLPNPWVEIASSLPVIALSSSPVLYAYLETGAIAPPVFLTIARGLRLLRLHRIFPDAGWAVLGTLTFCEILRSLSGIVFADTARYAAALRLLLVPEVMLVLGAVLAGSGRSRKRRGTVDPEETFIETQVGEEELAGLLGKKAAW